MAATRDTARDERALADDKAYNTEQWAGWAMAIVAILLGVIGLLRAFGMVGADTVALEGEVAPAGIGELPLEGNAGAGILWLFPAIAAGLLAMALRTTGRHETGVGEPVEGGGISKAAHLMAYIFAVVAVISGALALLTGFDMIGQDTTRTTGLMWGLFAVLFGTTTYAMHTAADHGMVANEDYLVRIVEQRVGPARTTAAGATGPGTATGGAGTTGPGGTTAGDTPRGGGPGGTVDPRR